LDLQADETGSGGLIDLVLIANILWRAKLMIVIITSIFAVMSVVFALSLSNQYKATVTVVPAESTSMSSLGRLASQFGGLASLAGINLGGDSDAYKTIMAMELVKTWDFLDNFIRDNNLEVPFFAATGWDRATDQLVINPDLYDSVAKEWVREFDPSKGQTAKPSSWKLYVRLRDRVSVSQDVSTGMITLSVEFYSPNIAKEWVDKLVTAINLRIRTRDRDQASESIEYLRRQIDQTSLAEMKNVFYQLIEEQTKNLMLTEVSEEYVFSVLSPARVPEKKSSPNRALTCISITILGFILAVFTVLLRSGFGGRPRQSDRSAD
jgi:capsular polysaccharide biosynthesis protein